MKNEISASQRETAGRQRKADALVNLIRYM